MPGAPVRDLQHHLLDLLALEGLAVVLHGRAVNTRRATAVQAAASNDRYMQFGPWV